MAFISLNKSSDPTTQDHLRINRSAVLYVEASRPGLVGQTTIHLLGQDAVVSAVTDPVATVVGVLGGLVAADRHYLAPPPEDGISTVYIASANVSYLRPNLPASPDFWYVRFVDGSELRIVAPLPAGL
jgi:hypothetical protein